MSVRTRSMLLGLAGLVSSLASGACGSPSTGVSAVHARLVADEAWSCPKDVAFLESLQTAYEHLEGRAAESMAELEASGLLFEDVELAATITDGTVVGTSADPCLLVVYTDLDLDTRCAAELDRFMIDVFTGSIVAGHLGSSLGPLEQARAVGVDHGPYVAYSWSDAEGGWENVDPTCPDEAELEAALREEPGPYAESACNTERKTLETATEAYVAQTGGPPVDERALVDAGFLRAEMDGFDLAPDGSVVPAPGSACA